MKNSTMNTLAIGFAAFAALIKWRVRIDTSNF